MLKDSLAFKTTDVTTEIEDLYNVKFPSFRHLNAVGKVTEKPKQPPPHKHAKKSVRQRRFRLAAKPQTDISESDQTDWSDIGGLSRLQLKRQTGYYRPTFETSHEDSDSD